MSSVVSPASADEALEMLRSAMGYLAAADATAMTAEEQARCLRVLERATSAGTAARTSVLGAFAHGQGPGADAEYSPRAWLIHKTGVTKGAAVSYTAWVRRAEEHPVVFTALAAGDLPESVARIVCQWTNRLPEDQRDAADDKLVAAVAAGMSLPELAGLFGEIYEQSRSASPDQDKDETFDDRAVRLITTFQGAGVLSGDLTPECAEAVAAVLDALAAPAGAEDTRTQEQRYHDALARKRCGAWSPRTCFRSGPVSRSRSGRTSRWRICSGWTAARRCRNSGRRRSGPGGPGTAPPRPRAAGTPAPGWTATRPRRSPATRRWPPS